MNAMKTAPSQEDFSFNRDDRELLLLQVLPTLNGFLASSVPFLFAQAPKFDTQIQNYVIVADWASDDPINVQVELATNGQGGHTLLVHVENHEQLSDTMDQMVLSIRPHSKSRLKDAFFPVGKGQYAGFMTWEYASPNMQFYNASLVFPKGKK